MVRSEFRAGRSKGRGIRTSHAADRSAHGPRARISFGDVQRPTAKQRAIWAARQGASSGTRDLPFVRRHANSADKEPSRRMYEGVIRKTTLVVLGAGPAGSSAAIWAARCGVETILL